MKFFLLINVKMPTTVGILTILSGKNSILGLSEPEKCCISWYFYTYEHLKFHAQLSWACKKFYNLGASMQDVNDVTCHPLGLGRVWLVFQAYLTRLEFCNPVFDPCIWRCIVTVNIRLFISFPGFIYKYRFLLTGPYSTSDENVAVSPTMYLDHMYLPKSIFSNQTFIIHTTVQPLYNSHPWDGIKVAVIGRWPLWRR